MFWVRAGRWGTTGEDIGADSEIEEIVQQEDELGDSNAVSERSDGSDSLEALR